MCLKILMCATLFSFSTYVCVFHPPDAFSGPPISRWHLFLQVAAAAKKTPSSRGGSRPNSSKSRPNSQKEKKGAKGAKKGAKKGAHFLFMTVFHTIRLPLFSV